MKYKFIALQMALFIFALLLSSIYSTEVTAKQEGTISDFINGFAGTPGSETFLEKTFNIAHRVEKPLNKKKGKKGKTRILKRPKLVDSRLYVKGWLQISSISFKNTNIFPPLSHSSGDMTIKVNKKNFRINEDYEKGNRNGPPGDKYFWFRLTGRHLYYSSNRETINVLDNIHIKHLKYAIPQKSTKKLFCFKIVDFKSRKYNLCANNVKERNNWVCFIQKALGHPQDSFCKAPGKNGKASNTDETKFVVQTITQPLLIIPQPSPSCNENWNYIGNGNNWECECKEGKEQSPINLPPHDKAILSNVKPVFHYELISPISPKDFKDGLVKKGESIKIRYIDHAIRIYHPNMGRVVTIDGASYTAQEIVFHTPSEHTINGKRYDMEMQVIHTGTTQGDIAKNVVLSVLFTKKAGYYNKFLDKLDPYNLPNPHEPYREITEDLFIPHIFSQVNDPEIPIMKPFSFYTYQGSLTQPPCSQRTIHYVASKPLFLSSTTLEMFKEALKTPDLISENGNVQVSNFLPLNFRSTQKLNGRAVFYYDNEKMCGQGLLDDFNNKKVRPKGHFEKRISKMTEYFFVNGQNPSGLPGALVVSEKEAKGIRGKR